MEPVAEPAPEKKASAADYEWGQVLGQGAFGDVCTTNLLFSLLGCFSNRNIHRERICHQEDAQVLFVKGTKQEIGYERKKRFEQM